MGFLGVVALTTLLCATLTVGQQGNACSVSNCRLPTCFCAGRRGPVQLQTKDLPQIVVFTFDDAMNTQNIDFYRYLFRAGRKNPNGCPIAATFFVSHEWTDYEMVKELYLSGHEISSHSISHKMPQSWWSSASYAELREELEGQRRNIARQASIPKREVRGLRVPFLETGGDVQFSMMRDEGFEYDSSFIAGPYSEADWRLPIWPYTLDFAPNLEFCDHNNCPKGNFSGIWEFPLNRWIGLDGKACPMVDACTTHTLDTKRKTLEYLWKNFRRFNNNNKAPFGINMHATWFKGNEHRLKAMDEFITALLRRDDVYIVTVHQLVEWMKTPTSLKEANNFGPWHTTCFKKRSSVDVQDDESEDDVKVPEESNDVIYDDANNSEDGTVVIEGKPPLKSELPRENIDDQNQDEQEDVNLVTFNNVMEGDAKNAPNENLSHPQDTQIDEPVEKKVETGQDRKPATKGDKQGKGNRPGGRYSVADSGSGTNALHIVLCVQTAVTTFMSYQAHLLHII